MKPGSESHYPVLSWCYYGRWVRGYKQKTPAGVFFVLVILFSDYFLPAFFASISCFAARRAFDLYGRVLVFFFGLNAIIRVIWAVVYM